MQLAVGRGPNANLSAFKKNIFPLLWTFTRTKLIIQLSGIGTML